MKAPILHILLLIMLATAVLSAQKNPTAKAQPIVAEGRALYHTELASWHGTDLFLADYPDKTQIGGYFSYLAEGKAYCVWYDKGETSQIIGTIAFSMPIGPTSAVVDLSERPFTKFERELLNMRIAALAEMEHNPIFKVPENANFNIVPFIYEGKSKVYILTGPKEIGVVIFGNDYLLNFKKGKLKEVKALHKNLIPVTYEGSNGEKMIESFHSHTDDTGDFVTVTDICTLLLYGRYTSWKSHSVVSKKYYNIWDVAKEGLVVLPTEAMRKIGTSKQ